LTASSIFQEARHISFFSLFINISFTIVTNTNVDLDLIIVQVLMLHLVYTDLYFN